MNILAANWIPFDPVVSEVETEAYVQWTDGRRLLTQRDGNSSHVPSEKMIIKFLLLSTTMIDSNNRTDWY
jgi:hypothetical protein